jgi:N4-gp56 family major capsid protein
MSQTSVPAGSPLAVKEYSVALFAQSLRNPSIMRNLTGPAPQIADAQRKLKNQTSPSMPIVRVTDLSKTAGDSVTVDCVDIIGGKPTVGDRNAEGTGEKLTFSNMDIRIDLITKVVDAGGKMSQQRTRHQLRSLAMANLGGYMPRLESQLILTHLAGARGQQNGDDWAVPLQSDADFSDICVNPVKAPTYNRHYVVSTTAGELTQGGAAIPSLTSACTLKLEHVDFMKRILEDLSFKLQPMKIADDPAAEDEPLYVWLVTNRVYQDILTAASGLQIRSFQQNAFNRASWGSKHPLFKGEVGIWNNILIKKVDYAIRWAADGASTTKINSSTELAGEESGSATMPSIAGYTVERTLLLGAQALGNVYGRNQSTDYYYGWLENKYNFMRSLEIAAEMMGGKAKLRFSPKNSSGTPTLTDHGVFVVDCVSKGALV